MLKIDFKKYFVVGLSLLLLSGIGIYGFTQQAQAQPHGRPQAQPQGRQPAQFQGQPSPHQQRQLQAQPQGKPPVHQQRYIDSRYQHNRSYPARGQSFRALPRDHRVVMHDHTRYYSSHGVWYRPHRGSYIVIAPPVGLFAPFLPLAYTTIWLQGIPYYYANGTYYTQTPGGYIVVEPPVAEGSGEMTESKMFIYPREGQSEEKQASDRYECHQWAVGQANYDPTRIPPEIPGDQIIQKRADYQRAMAACLDSRGYTAK